MGKLRHFFTDNFYLTLYLALIAIAIIPPSYVLHTMDTRVDTIYIHDTFNIYIHDTMVVMDTIEIEYADNFIYLSAMTDEEETEYNRYWDSVDGVHNDKSN